MDPDTAAELIEALSNGVVTFSRDVLRGSTPTWTTPAKIKPLDSEVQDGSPVEVYQFEVAANTPWRPAIGDSLVIEDDEVDGRVFSVSKAVPKGFPTNKFVVEARA